MNQESTDKDEDLLSGLGAPDKDDYEDFKMDSTKQKLLLLSPHDDNNDEIRRSDSIESAAMLGLVDNQRLVYN